MLAGTLSQSALFAYLAVSPLLLIDTYGLSPQAFGWVFAVNGAGLIGASQFNRRLVRTLSPHLVLKRVNLIALVTASILAVNALTGFGGLFGILVPLFLTVATMGFSQPNGVAGALSVDPRRAGSTSALYGFAQFAIGFVSSALAAALHDGSPRPLAFVILAAMSTACLVMRLLLKG